MLSHPPDVIKEVYEQKEEWVYQCKNCLTVCDVSCSATGDGNVAATVEALPEAFVCPLCESGPSDFTLVSKPALGLQAV